MHIVDLRPENELTIRQVAALLVEGFAINWPGSWQDLESALEEVRKFFATGRISRIAQDSSDGRVLGRIGGISQYWSHVWELHSLVVRISQQGKGIKRAFLVKILYLCYNQVVIFPTRSFVYIVAN